MSSQILARTNATIQLFIWRYTTQADRCNFKKSKLGTSHTRCSAEDSRSWERAALQDIRCKNVKSGTPQLTGTLEHLTSLRTGVFSTEYLQVASSGAKQKPLQDHLRGSCVLAVQTHLSYFWSFGTPAQGHSRN